MIKKFTVTFKTNVDSKSVERFMKLSNIQNHAFLDFVDCLIGEFDDDLVQDLVQLNYVSSIEETPVRYALGR